MRWLFSGLCLYSAIPLLGAQFPLRAAEVSDMLEQSLGLSQGQRRYDGTAAQQVTGLLEARCL